MPRKVLVAGLVVLDIDGVLADFMGKVQSILGPPADPHAYSLHEAYPNAHGRVDEIVADPETYCDLRPIMGARPGVRKLHDSGLHMAVVTARPKSDRMKQVTIFWISKYFRGDFVSVDVVGWEEKAEFIKAMNPWLAIDDAPFHLEKMRNLGITVVAFDQPWNHTMKFTKPIPRLYSWRETRMILGV